MISGVPLTPGMRGTVQPTRSSGASWRMRWSADQTPLLMKLRSSAPAAPRLLGPRQIDHPVRRVGADLAQRKDRVEGGRDLLAIVPADDDDVDAAHEVFRAGAKRLRFCR